MELKIIIDSDSLGAGYFNYDEALRGWHALGPILGSIRSSEICLKLFEMEIKGKKRKFILERISARLKTLISMEVEEILNDYIEED